MAPVRRYRTSRYTPYARVGAQTYQPAMVMAPAAPITRSYRYSRPGASTYRSRSYGRYRSKWSNTSTAINPVYPRPEVKNFDYQIGTSTSPLAIPETGLIRCINQIPAGVGPSQRIGRSIATKSVYYQFVLRFGTGEVPNVLRHVLLYDRQPNGDFPPTAASIFSSTEYITSPLNLQNNRRFVVLSDDRTSLSPQGDQIRIITDFRNVNQITQYENSDDLDITPTTGALIVFFATDIPTSTDSPTVSGTWRIRYLDC